MLDIYQSIYGFEGQPFRLSPDYRFSFGHRSYEDAKSYLKYAVNEGEGIVAITGAPGTGKTTLIASLISELDADRVCVGVISNVQLENRRLADMALDAFSLDASSGSQSSAPVRLKHFFIDQLEKGRRAILIVDEAQGLSREQLEELRLLSNLQHNTQLLLQVFLIGQESLMEVIRLPGMEQLHQRLIAAAQLRPLTLEETVEYIEHRLRVVNWTGDPEIRDEVFNLVHKFSSGIPRRINLICHRLFLQAGLRERHTLLGGDALHVIVELHKEGLLTAGAQRALGEYAVGVKGLASNE